MNSATRSFSYLFLVLLLLSIFLVSPLPAQQRVSSYSKYIAHSKVTMRQGEDLPIFIHFTKGNQPLVDEFFSEYQKSFGLSADNTLREERVFTDNLGITHHRLNQYYRGIEVTGAQYILHERNGIVESANGRLIHRLNVDATPTLSEDAALQRALEEIGAESYMWENPNNEAFLKREQKDPQATFYPAGNLIITSGFREMRPENFRLAYRFDIYAQNPLGRYYVDVDAQSGEILNKINRIQDADVPGSGNSLYNGVVPMTVDQVTPFNYRLQEHTTRGAAIETYDMQNGSNYAAAVDFTSATAIGPWDGGGVSGHFGAEATYDYYWNDHGRNSLDDAGFTLLSYVHTDLTGLGYPNNNNAFWDGSRMTYGDGDGTNFTPLVSLDVVGHELTHGVTEFSANLIYEKESGALNESFSDIFGNLVEFDVEGNPGVGTGSWRVGEDITTSGLGIRNMADPNEFGDPDTYGGTNWFNVVGCTPSNANDQCGVHTNSGVQNFWFFLLSDGGSGTNDNGDPYNVTGIGTANAAAIAYRNLTVYMTTSSNYADARAGAINAATDLFGTGSPEVQSTMDAWDAVGVYGAPPPSGILVWEGILGGQDYSGAYINTFLTNAGFSTQYTDVFPASLIGYDAVFLSFGNFGTTSGDPYTAFNNTMAAAVQQYLEAGGKVYLEGGDALGFDQSGNTTLLNLFGLSWVADGSSSSKPITALAGQSGAITNGMLFNSSTQVDNIYIDTFTPNTGIVAFNEPTVGDVAVQNSGSFGQKSFCFSYALSELTDGISPSTKDDLLAAIVNFFGLQLPTPDIDVSPTSFAFTVPFEGTGFNLLSISNVAPSGYPDLVWNILDLEGTVLLENDQSLPVTFQPALDGKYQIIKPPVKSAEFYKQFSSMNYSSRLTQKFKEASKSPDAVDPAENSNGNAAVKLDPRYRPNSGFRSTLLYDNGPLVNSPGTGVGGADESVLQTTSLGMNTLGFGHQASSNNRIADEFTVADPSGWAVDSLVFYAYQSFSSTASTITAVNYQIWDGPPDNPGSTVIFGDVTTNRLMRSRWSNIYRVTETSSGSNTDRPVMANTVSAGFYLPPGTYWLDWQTDGTLTSGPWAPPITINGQTTTGNALQSIAGTWGPVLDSGTGTPQGFPFLLYGTATSTCSWLSESPTAGIVSPGNTDLVNINVDASGLAPGFYNCSLVIYSNDFNNYPVIIPVTLDVQTPPTIVVNPTTLSETLPPGGTSTQTLDVNNIGQDSLNFAVYAAETFPKTGRASNETLPEHFAQNHPEIFKNPAGINANVDENLSAETLTKLRRDKIQSSSPKNTKGKPPYFPPSFGRSLLLEDFNSGVVPPSGWTVIDNASTGMIWKNIDDAGESGNYTGGAGNAATASSDKFGPAEFDTELRTPIISNPGPNVMLSYVVNYQNYAGLDFLDVDISTDGGATWTTMLSWNEDHGGFRSAPGEMVVLALDSYIGSAANFMIRWHYYDPNTGDWDWYAQIDDVIIFQGCSWLTVTPTMGTVPPGGPPVTLNVDFDATGLTEGIYNCEIIINSNDPFNSITVVPVQLHIVLPPPDINVAPASFTFNLPQNSVDSDVLTISNTAGSLAQDLIWSIYEQGITLRTENGSKIPVSIFTETETVSATLSSHFIPAGIRSSGTAPELPLTVVSPKSISTVSPTQPNTPLNVLWDQPISTLNTNAYANQDFESANDVYDIFIADDFTNTVPWVLTTIYVPGNTWNIGGDLTCATAFHWQIYADAGGVPAGDPYGGGAPPVWNLTLLPTDPMITLSTGVGGYLTNVTLNLPGLVTLPPGTWWLVFYPEMSFGSCFQSGRHVSETNNGNPAQVINPGGGFSFPTSWTSVQDPSTWGLSTQDFAFRLDGLVGVGDVPWISENPTSGIIPPGNSENVDITVDATGMTPGSYNCNLIIGSNDPDENPVTVPVTLNVLGPPDIAVSPASFTFDVPVGGSGSDLLTISNTATGLVEDLNWGIVEEDVTVVMENGRELPVKLQTKNSPETPEPTIVSSAPGSGSFDARKWSEQFRDKTRLSDIIPQIDPNTGGAIDALGDVITSFPAPGSPGPIGVAYDAGLNGVWVTDEFGAQIFLLDVNPPYGILQTIPIPAGLPGGPDDIAVVGDTLYITDFNGDLITFDDLIFSLDKTSGTLIDTWELDGAGNPNPSDNIDQVIGIAVNDNGEFFVSNNVDGIIRQVDLQPGGNWQTLSTFTSPLGGPTAGLDWDALMGGFWVANIIGMPVWFSTPDFHGLTSFPSPGLATSGITSLEDSTLWASDFGTNLIYILEGLPLPCSWLSEMPAYGSVPPGGNQNVTIMVDATGLTPGTYNCDMKIYSNDPDENPVTVPVILNVTSATTTFNQDMAAGWNMIGLPLDVVDPYYLTVYPNAVTGTLFGFNGSYFTTDTLFLSEGYWLRFPAAEIVAVQGTAVNSLTLTMASGWNMIAGPSCDVPLADVSDPGGIIVPGTLFGFDGSYTVSDTIKQGEGYWLRTSSAGLLNVACTTTSSPSLAKGSDDLIDLAQYPSVKIHDISGHSQTLYFGVEIENPETKLSFSMPPLPPKGAFDARFAGDYRISETEEATILLQSSQYPVTISAPKLPAVESYTYVLKEIVAGKEVASHELREGETVEISNPNVKKLRLSKEKIVPLEFTVAQNYPNPFNPTTVIKYGVPSPERVEIAIYNTLGQKVRTLVNGNKDAGYYEVVWDGSNDFGQRVGSGIYFYTVKAGKNSAVKKMILMK